MGTPTVKPVLYKNALADDLPNISINCDLSMLRCDFYISNRARLDNISYLDVHGVQVVDAMRLILRSLLIAHFNYSITKFEVVSGKGNHCANGRGIIRDHLTYLIRWYDITLWHHPQTPSGCPNVGSVIFEFPLPSSMVSQVSRS